MAHLAATAPRQIARNGGGVLGQLMGWQDPFAEWRAAMTAPAPTAPAPTVPAPSAPAPVAPAPTAPVATAPSRAAEVTALTDESQIKLLTRKVDQLVAAKAVTVQAGGRYRLTHGATVEVPMTVRDATTNAEITRFVVHYHPGAAAASTSATASSRMHIKKWANAAKFNRDDTVTESSLPNLYKLIPKFRDVTRNWETLPTGGLYKPR